MSVKTTLSLFLFVLLSFQIQAQEVWSLQKCVEHARKNSLDVLSAEVAVKSAEGQEKVNKMARLPNLNFGTTGQFNYGRSIDFTTNTFNSERAFNNSLSLNTNVPIYQGGAIQNRIKQSGFDLAAAKASAKEASNNISLLVANAYLQILFSEERLVNAKNNRAQTQRQLDQTDRLIQAGTVPRGDRLSIVAQLAQNDQAIIIQENNVEVNYLSLKNLLLLEPDFDLQVERPNIPVEAYEATTIAGLGEVYPLALQSQPQIRRGEMNLRSAELGIDIAKANLRPSLTLFANLNSNFSSRGKDLTKPDVSDISIQPTEPESVEIDNMPSQIVYFRPQGEVRFPDAGYGTQLTDNFGQGLGVSLNVPIFNRGVNNFAVERARLNIISTEVQNKQVRQQLKADIQNAVAQAKAAKRTLSAARLTVQANQDALSNAEKRFDLGAINSFELTQLKNAADQSEIELIIAKYDYLFKLKIVDFYMGRELKLD